jgi:hypothetical protein
MTGELQSKLVEVMSSLQTSLGQGSDFAMQQLPELARQYITYGRIWYSTAFAASVVLCAVCLWAALRCWRSIQGHDTEELDLKLTLCCCGAFLFLIGALATVQTFLLVWLAPKVWLLQEIVSLARGR